MEEKYFTISTHRLTNHCPECYSADGLELTFKQRFNETTFYRAITAETTPRLYCTTCKSEIYPVRWEDDLERVVNYHQRALKPKKPSLKLKKLSWILILLALVIVVTLIITYFKDVDVI